MGDERQSGCFISAVTGFILILLAIIIAVGVGIIVFFAAGREVKCTCEYPAGAGNGANTADALTWSSVCKNISSAGKQECLAGLPCPGDSYTSTDATPTTVPPSVIDVRLPGDLHPHHYKVELFPDMYHDDNVEDFKIIGNVEILMECKKATDEVIFHINELTIDASSIEFAAEDTSEDAPNIQGDFVDDKERQFFRQKLDKQMVVGKNYSIKIDFEAPLKKGLAGLYLSEYIEANNTKYMATTQFQATDARKAFPCFDEPGVKSTFEITLIRKDPMKSLSNMNIIRTENREDGKKADVYQTTVKMPTYLLAFVVCDFIYKEKNTTNGVRFRVWSRREAIEQTQFALDTGVAILTYFEEYFNIPFPLPKQDMIAAPDFAAGAMENWGLIIYRETALLYDDKESSAFNKQRVAVVVSHELAHQWFGNLVTPSWWDDLWLNEGFASYVEYLGVNHTQPDWNMMDQFVWEDLQDVFKIDGLASSHPVYVPVNHPDEISEIFDRISYAKGASILRMMNNFLSEDTFRNGLTKYLSKFQYANANHTDLWQSLKEQSDSEGKNIDVGDVMNTWVLQMGYPVITVTRSGTTATAKQKHYLIDPTQEPDPKYETNYNYRWEVPFTYITKTQLNWDAPELKWMHKEESVTLTGLPSGSNEWILGNVHQMGYYRVDYDSANWDLLINQLETEHTVIDVKNRAQIIDDAFSLARAGAHNVNQQKAMDTTGYLSAEMDYAPWDAAISNLAYIDSMLSSTDAYGEFQNYMLSNLVPLYNYTGWEDVGTHLNQYLRVLSLGRACAYGYRPCRDEALRLFKQWMDNPSVNNISPNLKTTVYCNAIRQGGVEEWDFAFDQFKKENLASERDRLRVSLACSAQPWILQRYLSWTLDGAMIRTQDALSTVVYIARNQIGQPLAWDHVRGNWNKLFNDFGTGFFSFTSMISGVTDKFSTEFQLNQLEEFVEAQRAVSKLGSGQRAFEQAIEKTNGNIKWLNDNKASLKEWLVKYNQKQR